jgi:transcriptional regulator with XRE-family HTH domain
MSQLSEIFAKNLKVLMQKDERSNAWLAEKSGLSATTIARILEMKSYPGIDTVEKISKVFGVDPAEMLKPIDKKASVKKHEEKVADHAETRRLIKVQTDYENSLKKIHGEIVEIKNVVHATNEKSELLEKTIALQSEQIEIQKQTIIYTEKLVRIFDGTPESLQKLRSIYGSGTPLSETELQEARSLVERAQEVVGPLPDDLIRSLNLKPVAK